jgi:hypothetical protein
LRVNAGGTLLTGGTAANSAASQALKAAVSSAITAGSKGLGRSGMNHPGGLRSFGAPSD